jgi:hypothetical protein
MSLWRTNPITMVFATFGVVAALATTTIVLKQVGVIDFDLFQFLTDSDEAPIRVRNGSLDLLILSNQDWEKVPGAGPEKWRIAHAKRHKSAFDLDIKTGPGATCTGSLTPSGTDIEFIYKDENDVSSTKISKITMESKNKRTVVNADTNMTMTWNPAPGERQKLTYKNEAGYLQRLTVTGGSAVTACSFAGKDQLVHLTIFNQP